MSAVTKFQNMVGKPLSLIEWSLPFADCTAPPCIPSTSPPTQMNDVRQYGAIPFLSWGSSSLSQNPDATQQPNFQLSRHHRRATTTRSSATSRSRAKNWGHPFFMRFNWEMNGNWFPWGDRGQRQPGRRVRRRPGSTCTTSSPRSAPPTRPGSGARTSTRSRKQNTSARSTRATTTSTGPASTATTGAPEPGQPDPVADLQAALLGDLQARGRRRSRPDKPMIFAEMATSDYGGDKAGMDQPDVRPAAAAATRR